MNIGEGGVGGRERGDWKSEVRWRLDSLKDVAIIKKTKSK